MSRHPQRRGCLPVDGVLLLDKPAGLTSNAALQVAKRMLSACKAGHTGSLDPIATGVLPLTFGEATKISQFLLNADKRYWARLKLGVSTRTYDSEGEITQQRPVRTSLREVEAALAHFRGEIDQVPPMYSAIKQGGRALYELAREGIEVEREPRRVTIHELQLLKLDGDELELEMSCSKGTYVRTLAHELGEMLGCGAHVTALRRLSVGNLSIDRAVTLDELEALSGPGERAARLLPPEQALEFLPPIDLTRLASHYLRQGQPVSVSHRFPPGTWVRLHEEGGAFLGMGEVQEDGLVAPRRLFNPPARAAGEAPG
ncbi:MAG: tRNA pseudouridine(55) synthase TruB [Pseudomonadota bacterium]